jgi:hypothetical protein
MAEHAPDGGERDAAIATGSFDDDVAGRGFVLARMWTAMPL